MWGETMRCSHCFEEIKGEPFEYHNCGSEPGDGIPRVEHLCWECASECDNLASFEGEQ